MLRSDLRWGCRLVLHPSTAILEVMSAFFISSSSQNKSVGLPKSAAPISVAHPSSRILIAVKDAEGACKKKSLLALRNQETFFAVLDAIRFLEQSAQPTPYSLVRPQASQETSLSVKILLDIYSEGFWKSC